MPAAIRGSEAFTDSSIEEMTAPVWGTDAFLDLSVTENPAPCRGRDAFTDSDSDDAVNQEHATLATGDLGVRICGRDAFSDLDEERDSRGLGGRGAFSDSGDEGDQERSTSATRKLRVSRMGDRGLVESDEEDLATRASGRAAVAALFSDSEPTNPHMSTRFTADSFKMSIPNSWLEPDEVDDTE